MTTLNETTMEPAGATLPGKRVQHREDVEKTILGEAVRLFAERGFEGTTIQEVAERARLSKQNLMYYFPTKQALYKRVLDDVLDDWLARMASLADPSQDPADVLRAYVSAKLRFSREQPLASRVYAMEVIGGARYTANRSATAWCRCCARTSPCSSAGSPMAASRRSTPRTCCSRCGR